MVALTGLIKPCYVFAPRTMARRIGMRLFAAKRTVASVRLPWGAALEVDAGEGIGRELLHQNIFDIAVSETAWRLLKPGDVVVDVGANIGYMTSLFAARVGAAGSVEAFEPHPRVFARLERNVERLRPDGTFGSIRIHRVALGGRDGAAQLLEPASFNMNQGASTVAPGDAGSISGPGLEIAMARFDSLLGDRDVALLKVDVEGFEGEVLAGARCALAQGRIHNIIYEAHDCERSGLHSLLSAQGYSVFGVGHDLLGPKLTTGASPPRVDRGWESPSYLATRHPLAVQSALRRRGWQVLRAC